MAMETEQPEDSQASAEALKQLLRPLMKLLIARGVTAQTLHTLLQELSVEVADQAFRLDGAPPTDSRISVLTGVHRKKVREVRRAQGRRRDSGQRRLSVMATLVGRWRADPAFLDANGAPLALPRHAPEGPSFDRLVQAVSQDVRPRTILDELLRRGVVAMDQDGDTLSLHDEALVPRESEAERMHYFVRNLSDHMAAAVENVLTEEGPAPFLERAVFYNNLSAQSVDAIEALARQLSGDLLMTLNREGFESQAAAAEDEGAAERFRFGVYFFREDESDRDEGKVEGKVEGRDKG